MLTHLLDQGVLIWSLQLPLQPLPFLFWPGQRILHLMSLHFLTCWYFIWEALSFPPFFVNSNITSTGRTSHTPKICFRFSTSQPQCSQVQSVTHRFTYFLYIIMLSVKAESHVLHNWLFTMPGIILSHTVHSVELINFCKFVIWLPGSDWNLSLSHAIFIS